MIQLRISGRTGNQLFQYAMLRSYMIKNNINEDIYISMEHIEKWKKKQGESFRDYLADFNTINYIPISKTKENVFQRIIENLYKIDFKLKNKLIILKKRKWNEEDWKKNKNKWKKIMNKIGIYYCFKNDYDFYDSNTKNKIFFGSFESANFFDDIREKLVEELTPKKGKIEKNKELYKNIENSNSVCVTIRRGDFLEDKNINSFYICTKEYFEKAIIKMSNIIDNPRFVVFSDDIEWCKENMKFPENTLFEDGQDPVWEKLRLMYSCKHFIISNSTFSWWAQYLSRNKNKIVIAPDIWSKTNYCDDIYQDNWITIKP